MDTNDLYYSEGSQLIDNGNSSWMENTVLVGNENISWQEDGPEITVDYSEIAIDQSLVENEGYLTADTGDSDETSQYFSILESNCDNSGIINNNSNFSTPNANTDCVVNVEIVKEETIIPDITKSELVDDDEFNTNKNSDNQLVLYRMDGSDDLYAVQIADDGKGNFQKYQYKVTQSASGEFEPIPGSVEIHNTEIDEHSTNEETISHQPDFASHFIKEEPNSLDNSENILTDETSDNQLESTELQNSYLISSDKGFENINPEYVLQHSYDENEDYENVSIMHELNENGSSKQSKNIETTSFVNNTNIFPPGDDSESEYEIEALDEDFQDEDVLDENSYEEHTSNSDTSQILQHKSDTVNVQISNIEHENDLKQHLSNNRNVTIFKDDKHLSVLVVKAKEKENVLFSRQSTNFNPLNLRSILKSNCTVSKVNQMQKTVSTNQSSSVSITTNDEKNANICGDLMQIHTTAIKSIRQPRKQTITPIDRVGSEIIVQPLVYSLDVNTSSGVRSTSTAVKRKRVPDEILQISDESDPEFTLKSFKKKKSKRGRYPRKNTKKKLIEITIIESDDEMSSDESVIEVLADHESSFKHKINKTSPEGLLDNCNDEIEPIAISDNECTNDKIATETPTTSEKLKTNGNVGTGTSEKIEHIKNSESGIRRTNKCPMCPKTFPRQITLRKHLLIHSTRRNLRSRNSLRKVINETSQVNLRETRVTKIKQETDINMKMKFRCAKCKLNFLTEGQYKRHQTIHTVKRNSSGTTQITLKKQITSNEKSIKQIFSSPKRLRSSTKTQNEAPKSRKCVDTINNTNAVKEKLKCEYCGQIFSERTLFTFHRNSHKTFPCPNCKTTFTAKLLLDDHLRKNCLKSPVKKRLTRKSLMKCDICHLAFPTTKQLQNHISLVHKTKKNILKPETNKSNNRLIVKNRGAHGGVPMSIKMQKAFDKIKLKT